MFNLQKSVYNEDIRGDRMRILLITVGVIFTIIGFIGAVLPLLPTTPFLLVAAFCFAKSSDKFHDWLIETKIYKAYVEDFRQHRGYTLKNKFKLLISLYIVISFSYYMIDIWWMRIGLLIMVSLQTIVLFTLVKTIHKNDSINK